MNEQPVYISASQMAASQPPKRHVLRWVLIGLLGLIVTIILLIVVATAVTPKPTGEMETVSYTADGGGHYRLLFYKDHFTGKLNGSKTASLVSRYYKDDKFPIGLNISQSDDTSSYASVEDCGRFKKVSEVQNDNLGQKIAICDVLSSQDERLKVIVAGFIYNDKMHTISIAQNLDSRQRDALSKVDITTYQPDIEKIIASIAVE